MDNAHVNRPQAGLGQSVYEQEAASVVRRYDEVSRLVICDSIAHGSPDRETLLLSMTPD